MAWVDEIQGAAEKAASVLQVPWEWIAAQWHLETGGETPENNNLGGIKNNTYSAQRGYGIYGDTYMQYGSVFDFADDIG